MNQGGLKADKIRLCKRANVETKRLKRNLFRVCKAFMRRFDPDPRLQYFHNLRENPRLLQKLGSETVAGSCRFPLLTSLNSQ
jgi:hypothetical protein